MASDEPDTASPGDFEPTTRSAHGASASQQTIDGYRLLERVGSGGMGEVYRALQLQPIERTVALKVIKRGMDTRDVITRFEAERQALALMDHPNIAKVFAAGSTPEGRPYFVMEYVRGIPITAYADKPKLTTEQRLELLITLCEGVQHAHQKSIIHRDLKPSNVLVTIQDDKSVPKIIDFGVAKATSRKLTEKTMYTALGELIGTPEYMSPEQAEMTGEDIDTRTDVYSLGVILYELLVGALPFEPAELRRAGFEGIVRTIREQDPPRPSTKLGILAERATAVAQARRTVPEKLRGRLRGDLDWITMRALEKDRTRRYGSAAELAADIARHLRHEPVAAGPPSAMYRTRKFVRRHRVGVGFASVLVVLLAVLAVTMTVQAGRIARERDRANTQAMRANEEAESAREVTEFLVGLFDVSDPRVSLGDTIEAREILDLGAARIEAGEVERAPLLQARLLETMGRVYQNLGEYDRAGTLLEKALAMRRREQGERHADVGRALGRLGWLRGYYQSRLVEGKPFLLEALSIQSEAYGPRHVETGWALYYLGSALSWQPDPCATVYLERARKVFEDTLGAESAPVSSCWADLSSYYVILGEYDRGLECAQRAAEINEKILLPGSPVIAISRMNVGNDLLNLGRCEEARPILEGALRILLESLGPDHDHTAMLLRVLSELHRCHGDYREAREKATRAAVVFRSTLGPDHLHYHAAQYELALIALETGRLSEADSLTRAVFEAIEGAYGRESLYFASLLEWRAWSLRKIRRQVEAAALLDSAQAIRQRWRNRLQKCDGV